MITYFEVDADLTLSRQEVETRDLSATVPVCERLLGVSPRRARIRLNLSANKQTNYSTNMYWTVRDYGKTEQGELMHKMIILII